MTFNTILYTLLAAELLLVWTDADVDLYYANIFNMCYAGLMFVVVVFFLIYGVEVFFKVRLKRRLNNASSVHDSTKLHTASKKRGQSWL